MPRPLDDLDAPLSEVTFVVLDLETTGGSAHSCAITEVGALKLRGGECLGTFQTLVNPGVRLPPEITYLTGITESMVAPAPLIDSVLPAFAEFLGDAVIVGHNVRFDLGFLRANLARLGYGALTNRFVDTYALARRLVRDEVPNCKLRTLARHFRTDADPCHRALDDARATAEVLHRLLERVASLGVTSLDDLLALPTTAAHPQVAKLRWVATLPRRPGVYLFKDVAGRVLYVGRATDLRRRVRSYFASDDRRKIGPLLREASSLDHVVCADELEAAVLEVRLIHEHLPRYNRQVKVWSRYRYLKLTLDERYPRLAVVRSAKTGDGCLYLGPLPSAAAAKLTAEAIETALPLRRCTAKVRAVGPARPAPCTSAPLGVSSCPCSGGIDEAAYSSIVRRVIDGLTTSPEEVLGPLARRLAMLSDQRRFEEAADLRDRMAALARVLARQRRLDSLVLAGRIEVELVETGARVVFDRGRFVSTWGADASPSSSPGRAGDGLPLARDAVDEVACIAAWLDANARRIRLVHAEHGWTHPAAKVPRYEVLRARRDAPGPSAAVA